MCERSQSPLRGHMRTFNNVDPKEKEFPAYLYHPPIPFDGESIDPTFLLL